MKIRHISDTHGYHEGLVIEDDIDILIHSGDCTTDKNPIINQLEFDAFFKWFKNLKVKHKVLIAGNHDWWALKLYNKLALKEAGIIYLEHDYETVEGLLIFGSPFTPNFGNWHFMKNPEKLSRFWEVLIPGIDILVTHGPPKGQLDLSHDRDGNLDYCGDGALLKSVFLNEPKYHLFGHIHDSDGCFNYGVKTIDRKTTFINSALVRDGKPHLGVVHQGHTIHL